MKDVFIKSVGIGIGLGISLVVIDALAVKLNYRIDSRIEYYDRKHRDEFYGDRR